MDHELSHGLISDCVSEYRMKLIARYWVGMQLSDSLEGAFPVCLVQGPGKLVLGIDWGHSSATHEPLHGATWVI